MIKKKNSKLHSKRDFFSTDHLMSGLKTSAVRGGGIIVVSRGVNFFIQFTSVIFLARLLTPDDFGLFAMVTAFTGVTVIFRDIGLTDATIQKPEINHKLISTVFWINLALSLLITLVLIGLSPIVVWFYNEPKLQMITIVWSVNLIFGALSTQHVALLKRQMLFFQVSLNEIIAVLLSNVAAIVLAFYGCSYWALVLRPIVLVTVLAIGVWIICPWRPGLPAHSKDLQSMLVFGGNTVGYYFIDYLSRSFDKILLGWRFGPQELGYYSKAYQLFLLPTTQLTQSLRNVAIATLSKLQYQPSEYQRYYLKAISILSFFGMPVSFFLMIESESLILLVLGPQWVEAVEIFQILSAGAGIWIIYSTIYWIHASLGTTDRLRRWGIVALSITVIAILIGLNFGIKGVAVAYTLSLYILAGIGLKYAVAPVNLKFYAIVRSIWKYFIAALFAGLGCWYAIDSFEPFLNLFVRIIYSFFLFSCFYLIFVVVLFQSIKPIIEFYSLIREIFPKSAMSRSKS